MDVTMQAMRADPVSETTRIVLYGLLAAASPTTLLATLVVLASSRGRANGVSFTAAYVLGTAIAFTIGLLVGHSITRSHASGFDVATTLEIVAGVALLAIAAGRRHPRAHVSPDRGPSPQERFGRFVHVKPAVSFGIGLPLGIGAKRLTITLLAAATVTVAEAGSVEETGLGVIYIVVASLVVWVPIAVYLLLGSRADAIVVRSQAWITEHEQGLTFGSLLVLGLLLVGDGLIRIVV